MLFKTSKVGLAPYGGEGEVVVKAVTGKTIKEINNATKGIEADSDEYNTIASYTTCMNCIVSAPFMVDGKITEDIIDELPIALILDIVKTAGEIQNDIPLQN